MMRDDNNEVLSLGVSHLIAAGQLHEAKLRTMKYLHHGVAQRHRAMTNLQMLANKTLPGSKVES